MIHREATIKYKGYDPNTLSKGSNKRICCVCNNCGRVRWITMSGYRDLCHKCACQSMEFREKMHEVNKGQSAWNKGIPMNDNQREKLSKSQIERYKDPKVREKHSKIQKELWKNYEYHKMMSDAGIKRYEDHNELERARKNRLKQVFPSKDTSIELKIQNILIKNGYIFKKHQACCNICQPDILFLNEKIIIQCDGDYWHNYPDGTDKDKKQDKVLTENGWNVIRFWEHEINENIENCLNKFELEYYGGIKIWE